MESQFFGSEFDNVYKDWRAKQNDQGVIYYVNDTKQITSWNHPYFSKVLDELDIKYGQMKYVAYRTSFKLRDLQSRIGLKWIHLAAVNQVFVECLAEGDMHLTYSEALSLIQNALHLSDKVGRSEEDIRTAADLILNLMMSLYDVNRCGKIENKSVKNALAAMSCASLNEKYRLRDENQNVCREKLVSLLDGLMQLPFVINEGESFGRNVTATVDSCFKVTGDSHSGKISKKSFYFWLTLEPQTLIWLPTLHRILATEAVQHNERCSVCGALQITGLRYRCLQCLNYAMCQGCFLHGHTSLRHKLKHPVREYCLPASVKDNTKAFLAILKNKLGIRHSRWTQSVYLPVDTVTEHYVLNERQPRIIQNNSSPDNSSSLDSGLAIGSDREDVCNSGHVSQSVIEECGIRTQKKSLGILGEPCNSSSPLTGGCDQDFALLSRRNIEMQQKQMALTIEKLQKENRILKSKLDTIYKYCDSELTDERSVTDECKAGKTMISYSRDLLKEIYDAPISPIVDCSTDVPNDLSPTQGHFTLEKHNTSNIDDQEYIRHIIGAFTPVGSTPLSKPSPQMSHNQKSEQSTEFLDSIEHNESSMPEELGYKSLPYVSMKDDSNHEQLETGLSKTCVSESTLPDKLMYRLSDISLDFQDTTEQSQISHADLSKSENSLGSQTAQSTEDLIPVNCAVKAPSQASELNSCSTRLSTKKRGQHRHPCLVFSSSSLKSRSEHAISADLKINSDNMDTDTVNDCLNPFTENFSIHANEDDSCVELSEIFHHGQTLLHSTEPTPVHIKTAPRRKTVQPVHMSTPVNDTLQFLRKQPQSMGSLKFSDANANKENMIVTPGKRKFKHCQSGYNNDITPLSAISWQRRGVLMSVNSLPFNHSLNSYNLSDNGGDIRNLSSFFRKAEQIGNKINDGTSENMVTHERDELVKMIMDFEKEYKSDDNTHSGMRSPSRKVDDDNMLAAVQNIGDAMANFVQATAKSQHED